MSEKYLNETERGNEEDEMDVEDVDLESGYFSETTDSKLVPLINVHEVNQQRRPDKTTTSSMYKNPYINKLNFG